MPQQWMRARFSSLGAGKPDATHTDVSASDLTTSAGIGTSDVIAERQPLGWRPYNGVLPRPGVQGPRALERQAARRIDVHAVVEDIVEAAIVRHHPGRVAHHDRACRHRPADDRAGADDCADADGQTADDELVRVAEEAVAELGL